MGSSVPCMTSVGTLTSPSRSLQRSPESMPAWLVMLEARLVVRSKARAAISRMAASSKGREPANGRSPSTM